MHNLDDAEDRDPYPPPWHAARIPPPSRGPVIEAYVDTETLDHPCNNCGAGEGEFCRDEHGRDRKSPCCKRINDAAATIRQRPAAGVNP